MHDLQRYSIICKRAMSLDEEWYPIFLAYVAFVTGEDVKHINTNIMRTATGEAPLHRIKNEDTDA